MLKQFLTLSLVTLSFLSLKGQSTAEVMFYNILNFPSGLPSAREDSLRKILQFHPVDLLMVCELKSEAGADLILNEALNVNNVDYFKRGTYVDQISDPINGNRLQQMVFYNSQLFTLYKEDVLVTETRDINEYNFYINDTVALIAGDTSWLDVFVTHLKSSQGASNEEERSRAVDTLIQYLNNLPPDRQIIFAGDCNFYSYLEPGFQKLIATNNVQILKDPINKSGNWHNNASFSAIHTQSTRTSQIFGDGAGGGVDDRFDFIFLSENMTDGTGDILYQFGSYDALGNDGTCFNENIINCAPLGMPPEIARTLYNNSDHIPVTLQLEIPGNFPSVIRSPEFVRRLEIELPVGNLIDNFLTFRIKHSQENNLEYTIFSSIGSIVIQQSVSNSSKTVFQIPASTLPSGGYFLQVKTAQVYYNPVRFFKKSF